MHRHIIINHDIGLYLEVLSVDVDIDLEQVIDELIIEEIIEIDYAEGAEKT